MSNRRDLIVATSVWLILSIISMILIAGVQIFPDVASNEARIEDEAMNALTVASMPVLMFVVVGVVYSAIRFRARDDDEADGPPIHGHRGVQVGWLAISFVLVIFLFAYGAFGLIDIRGAQAADFEVHVTGSQWQWEFEYPAYGIVSDELHVPVGQRTHLMIESHDVIHSLWLAALGVKQDAVPGHPTEAYVTATVAGTYPGRCAELCGLGHTVMEFTTITSDRASVDAWAAAQPRPSESPAATEAPQ